MLNMKKVITVVSGLVVGLSLSGAATQVSAATVAPKLGVAQDAPTNPSIKKGDKVFVIVQDTKKQSVTVYNKNAHKTSKTIKMGTTWTAKATKKVNGKKLVRVNKSEWLNANDLVKD